MEDPFADLLTQSRLTKLRPFFGDARALDAEAFAGAFFATLPGGLAGALGSTVGNPFDVVKTRMMAAEGKAIPSMAATFRELYAAQGVAGFYRGLEANVMRAVVLNGTKMACYDQIKGELVARGVVPKKGIVTDFTAAFGAGFFMTCTVAPFDKIRTRLMNQPPDAKIYSGFVDCFAKIVRNEGPRALWAGFIPIWARFAPTTTLQLVIFGQMRCRLLLIPNIESLLRLRFQLFHAAQTDAL
jgi:hypothetical protein